MPRVYKVRRAGDGRWLVVRTSHLVPSMCDRIVETFATRRLARAAARIQSRLRAHALQRVQCHVDRAKYLADLKKHADYVNRMYILECYSSAIERMKEAEQ